MGRRAADVTTPVPVLGVPALVGVRAWRATGGDRSGGALLHTWGLHCSVGVQTSPGISRPPTQLSDTPSTLSDSITQTSSSYISKETEYSQILLLTKTDKDKRAILKLKSGESKSKKEVTFRALRGEAPVDVACSQRNISGTFCYARAIKTNPHVAGSGKNVRPKLKPYINGSVVDSEAIGGICADDGEAEPVKGSTFRGRDGVRQRGHDAETLPLPAARPLVTPQNMCSHRGGRQAVIGAAALGENSPCADACPLTQALASHLEPCHTERNRTAEPGQRQNTGDQSDNTARPQILHLNDEASFRKHPACPVHSRGHVVPLPHAHAAGDAPPAQPTTTLQAKRVTVTKATIETTQAVAGSKIPRPTSLRLTPHIPSAAKPNQPQSHTLPLRTSSQRNSPPYSPGHRVPSEGKPAGVTSQHEMYTTQVNILTNRMSLKCPTSCKETKASDPTTQASPAGPSSDPAHKPQVKLSSKVKVHPRGFLTFVKTPQHTSAPQLSTMAPNSTLNPNTTSSHISTTCDANSEPSLHVTTAAVITTPTSTTALDSRAKLPSSTSLSSTSARRSAVHKTTALWNSSLGPKTTPATVSSSAAALMENQTNACGSRAALPQSADTRQRELSRNARGIRIQTGAESGVCSEAKDSKGARLAPSQDESKIHDARAHGLRSKLTPNTESDTDKSKCNGNLINELVVHEPQEHGNSNLSQVTNLQNYISLMRSGSSCLRGCINTEQQRQAHYQGYTAAEHEGHCGPCPPVKTAQETELKTEQLASGASARHANIKLKFNADKQTHPNYSSPSIVAQRSCIKSSPASANVHADPSAHCDSHVSSLHTGAGLCSAAPAPLQSQGALSTHAGPGCDATLPACRPRLRPHDAEAVVGAHSRLGPAPPQPWPEDAGLAHSHPAGAALLLPPSPQCCKSAALHQRLETVEASLAANKARITTLLNIIHDLETCHTPTSGRRGCQTGQDLKNCSTCQKTACVVYSVEYDFRQQERRFLEVLNQARGADPFPARLSPPLSFGLLRNLIRNVTKSKVKSKKLCKALFKWLPRKIQHV